MPKSTRVILWTVTILAVVICIWVASLLHKRAKEPVPSSNETTTYEAPKVYPCDYHKEKCD